VLETAAFTYFARQLLHVVTVMGVVRRKRVTFRSWAVKHSAHMKHRQTWLGRGIELKTPLTTGPISAFKGHGVSVGYTACFFGISRISDSVMRLMSDRIFFENNKVNVKNKKNESQNFARSFGAELRSVAVYLCERFQKESIDPQNGNHFPHVQRQSEPGRRADSVFVYSDRRGSSDRVALAYDDFFCDAAVFPVSRTHNRAQKLGGRVAGFCAALIKKSHGHYLGTFVDNVPSFARACRYRG
jgi:hypothetical protein